MEELRSGTEGGSHSLFLCIMAPRILNDAHGREGKGEREREKMRGGGGGNRERERGGEWGRERERGGGGKGERERGGGEERESGSHVLPFMMTKYSIHSFFSLNLIRIEKNV